MSVGLYMDVHVRRAVTVALRIRGVDVLTAREDGSERLSDPELLDRATALGRALFSQDEDLLGIAHARQERGERFSGVIYVHQLRIGIGRLITDLEILAEAGEPEDFANRVEYLPLV